MRKIILFVDYDENPHCPCFYINNWYFDFNRSSNNHEFYGIRIELNFWKVLRIIYKNRGKTEDKKKFGYVVRRNGEIYHAMKVKKEDNAKLVYELLYNVYEELDDFGEEILVDYISLLKKKVKKQANMVDLVSNLV